MTEPDKDLVTQKRWLIISWAHIDHLNDAYGALLCIVHGTYDDAVAEARTWIPAHQPVGVVEEIT